MFGIGSTELLLILVVALIVLGPKSLASVSRSLGKAVGEFRRVSTDFQRAINVEMAQEEAKTDSKKNAPNAQTTAASKDNDDDIPEDSPLAQAIAKARAEAAKSAASEPAATQSSGAKSHGV